MCDDLRARRAINLAKKSAMNSLAERYAKKREYESLIINALEDQDNEEAFYVVEAQSPPNTVVIVNVQFDKRCNPVVGQGYARCMYKDEFDPEFGFRVARKRAIRDAAKRLAGF